MTTHTTYTTTPAPAPLPGARNWLDLVAKQAALLQRWGRLRVLNEQAADLDMVELLRTELENGRSVSV